MNEPTNLIQVYSKERQGSNYPNLSIKLSDMGVGQAIIIQSVYGPAKEKTCPWKDDDGNDIIQYSSQFAYTPFQSSVESRVWLNMTEKLGIKYNALDPVADEYFIIKKKKVDDFKYAFYTVQRCTKAGVVQETLDTTPPITVIGEDQPVPNAVELDRIDKIRIGSEGKELTKDVWVGIFCKDYSNDAGRAVWLFDNHRNPETDSEE